jgi:hypothetical protein
MDKASPNSNIASSENLDTDTFQLFSDINMDLIDTSSLSMYLKLPKDCNIFAPSIDMEDVSDSLYASNFLHHMAQNYSASDSFSIDEFSELSLVRSTNDKDIIDVLFLDRVSLKKKPRYYLTMRQKPLKAWYTYSKSSGFIGDCHNYNSGMTDSLQNSNYPYSNNYFLANSNRLLNTTTLLVLPTNKHISIISNSFDVVHSWFIPGLGIKIDCVPGRSTHHTLYIDSPGFYYGQCAEVCGRFHHHMPIKVCALVFEHFLLW